MKILLLGDVHGNLDEGMKNTTFYIQQELSKQHNVLVLNPHRTFFPSTIKKVREFKPDIIHYVHGPSIRSLLVTRWLSKWVGGVKTVVSATHPNLLRIGKFMVRFLKPDLVLAQSKKTEAFFKSKGCRTALVSSGVDLNRFHPVSLDKKVRLRQQYGLPENAFIVLHVGPIRSNRNLEVFRTIQRELDLQVLIVGSTTVRADLQIVKHLEKTGCIVWVRYFPNIEHLFQLSDCYVFPVLSSDGAVEMPLTVLEAAACNLPVITTPFGGLSEFLSEGNDLYYVNDDYDLINALRRYRRNRSIQIRFLAETFSWVKITKFICEYYFDLIKDNEGGDQNKP